MVNFFFNFVNAVNIEISFFLNIKDSLLTEPLPLKNGTLLLSSKPGFGFEVDEDKLKKYRLDI